MELVERYKFMLGLRAGQGDQQAAAQLQQIEAQEAAAGAPAFSLATLPWYYYAGFAALAVGGYYLLKGK